jgi:hypothetical protein
MKLLYFQLILFFKIITTTKLCDILLKYVHADCAILNGGSLRSDRIHHSGSFLLKDLRDILSFDSELACVEVTGILLKKIR